jgi:hypothetical protein
MSARPSLAALLLLAACSAAPPKAKPRAARPAAKHVVVPAGSSSAAVHGPPRPADPGPVVEEQADPEGLRLFTARLAEPAVAPGPALAKVTAIALADTARGEAPSMTPLAAPAEATLAAGQRTVVPFTLLAGECLTFLAQGGLGVIEVDLFLVAADRTKGVTVLAQDAGTGPIAVIGGQGKCLPNPAAGKLDVEIHATVRRGAGVVLVQGFRK